MITQREALRACGLTGLDNGFSLIPINSKTKRPFANLLPLLLDDNGVAVKAQGVDKGTGEVYEYERHTWKPYQSERASKSELNRWVNAGAQLAVVCGQISGGLLIIDFDVPGFFSRWYKIAAQQGYPVNCLAIQRTGGGGWQVLLCCENPGENTKLAWVADDTQKSGRSVAIETRGEGGYAVIAPSLHPSGNSYRWRRGDLANVYMWRQEDVNGLLDIARSLSQVMDAAPQEYTPRGERTMTLLEGQRVVDAFNAKADIEDVLSRAGYTAAHGGRWHRPGYDRTSEPSVQILDNRSWHWSSNDPLSDGYWKTPFAVRLHYDFHNDVRAAVKTIAIELGMDYKRGERLRQGVRSASLSMKGAER